MRELAGKVDEQRSYNGPVGQDGFNHGTKVAGIIAGDSGLAPQARLWDIRVIDNNGVTSIATLLEALDDLMPNVNQIDILVGAFSDPTLTVLELVRQPPARLGGRGQFLP